MNSEKKNMEETKANIESFEAFTVVKAENPSELHTNNLVPIYEEYNNRNLSGEKTFRLIPRELATKILTFERNSMIPEDNFTEDEKQALNAFTKKKYIKSAKVAGKKVYFDLNSKIRRHVINVLEH